MPGSACLPPPRRPRSTRSAPRSVGRPSAARRVLLAVDFVLTRKPHEVAMKEALGWSAFYVALPLAFGGYVWSAFGSQRGLEYSPATWSRSR